MSGHNPKLRGRSDFLSSGCNTHAHCMAWAQASPQELEPLGGVDAEVVAYASHHWVALTTAAGLVKSSLIGHTGPVHCLTWLTPAKELVSGSADGTVRVWERTRGGWSTAAVLQPNQEEKGVMGVTSVEAATIGPLRLVASTSAYGLSVWCSRRAPAENGSAPPHGPPQWTLVHAASLPPTQIPHCLCLAPLQPDPCHVALLAGCLDSRVHVWSGSLSSPPLASPLSPPQWAWSKCGVLSGHQDWVRTMDFYAMEGGGYVASGAQDGKVRIWKIRALSAAQATGASSGEVGEAMDMDEEEEEEGGGGLEDEDHELRLVIEAPSPPAAGGGLMRFGVSLDALLVGHEDWVTGVTWRPLSGLGGGSAGQVGEEEGEGGLALLSACMDRSLILWRPEGKGGLWAPHVRLGDVGSDIGGPIGGNLLGFMGCDFAPDGRVVLAYGFGGSFHCYEEGPTGGWRPRAFCSGHFSEVADLQWEPGQGRYLVSVSKDQTCRLFSPVLATRRWHEMSRVQVHGYDLTCVELLGSLEHRLVSGADEKTLRVFDATNKVLGLLRELCGVQCSSPARTETAYAPALGLSNKAVTLRPEDEEEEEEEEEEGNGKGGGGGGGGENDDGEAISKARRRVTWRGPPLEQDLVDHTLWPEVHKLYGHVNGLTALGASTSGRLLASACKARDARAAVLRLWDTDTWRCLGALPGHQSTVVQLAFAHDDTLLVSVSRDRQICVFAPSASAEGGGWGLVKAYPKAHKRIIWSCSWSHDDALLATGSRDGVVKLWRREGGVGLQEACSFEPLSKGSDGSTSVTAVAFLPRAPVFNAQAYVLAVGLECGEIELWAGGPGGETPWQRLGTLLETQAHAATVRRLRWKPHSGTQGVGEAVLASCGADHAVRVTTVEGI